MPPKQVQSQDQKLLTLGEEQSRNPDELLSRLESKTPYFPKAKEHEVLETPNL